MAESLAEPLTESLTESHVEVLLTPDDLAGMLASDVRTGLLADPPDINSKHEYDEVGSAIFLAKTLGESGAYDLTRRETELLRLFAQDIINATRADSLVELGAGYGTKITLLLDALSARRRLHGGGGQYVPFDIDRDTLLGTVDSVVRDYPGISVHGIVGDLDKEDHLRHLNAIPRHGGSRAVAFLGSSLGNMRPARRHEFLRTVADTLSPADTLLLGVDLVRRDDIERHVRAYNDPEGHAERFERHLLDRINNELGGDFDQAGYQYRAYWSPQNQWVEMGLFAVRPQTVHITRLDDLEVHIPAGRPVRIKIAAKFSQDQVEGMLSDAGLTLYRLLTDPTGSFGMALAVPVWQPAIRQVEHAPLAARTAARAAVRAATDGPVRVGGPPLTVDDVVRVAAGAPVAFAPAVHDRIAASHATLRQHVAAGNPVYGIVQGLGQFRDQLVVDPDRPRRIILGRHVGVGSPLPAEQVRAAMLVRIALIATGRSGASPALADAFLKALNAGFYPAAGGGDSVGAGDLPPMAAIGAALLGDGHAIVNGEILPAKDALQRAGLPPLHPTDKDGLATVAVNGVGLGHSALVVARAGRLVAAADVAAALSLEALRERPGTIANPLVADAKPALAGLGATVDHLAKLLDGSRLWNPDAPAHLQPPLSLRDVPQVHGATRDFVASARDAVEAELNGSADNPMVDAASGQILCWSGFCAMNAALTVDALRPALTHVGVLIHGRVQHLLGRLAADGVSLHEGTTAAPGALQFPTGARVAELQYLAAPATTGVPPLESGIEDHASGLPLAAKRTDESLDFLTDLLGLEVRLAYDSLLAAARQRRRLGAGVTTTLDLLDQVLPPPGAASSATRHQRVVELIEQQRLP